MNESKKLTGEQANATYGDCVQASCVDHIYTVEGPASVSIAQAVRPWPLSDVMVEVRETGLMGWGHDDFIRVTATDGQPIVCLMATRKAD